MTLSLNHIHFKSADPRKTAQWYVDNIGAKIVSDNTRGGQGALQIDIHGLRANVSGILPDQDQKRQHYGLEHIAINSTSYEADKARVLGNGGKVLEERGEIGRRTIWFEAPDGVQVELLERAA